MFETDDGNNDVGEGARTEVGIEAVKLLLSTLKRRMVPFRATRASDSRQEDDVARYREGQRCVPQGATKVLEEMVLGVEGEEEVVEVGGEEL